MKEEVEYYFEIDQYLKGELSDDALVKFEKALAENPALRNEVASQKLLNDVVLGAQLDLLRERIKKDIDQIDQNNNNTKNWLLGASLVLLIGAGLGIASYHKPEKTPRIDTIQETQPITVTDAPKKIELPVTQNIGKPVKKDLTKTPPVGTVQETISAPVPAEYKKETVSQETPVSIVEDTSTINLPSNIASAVELNDCQDGTIVFTISSKNSCLERATGEVKVDEKSLKGGAAPYSFELNRNGKFTSEAVYTNLKPGHYTITVKDQKGCTVEQTIEVNGKECYKKRSFSFSPELGETLKISVSSEEAGVLSIYNRAGLLIFKTQTDLAETVDWNGTDLTGNVAPSGLYVYIVEYANGEKENGQITVLR